MHVWTSLHLFNTVCLLFPRSRSAACSWQAQIAVMSVPVGSIWGCKFGNTTCRHCITSRRHALARSHARPNLDAMVFILGSATRVKPIHDASTSRNPSLIHVRVLPSMYDGMVRLTRPPRPGFTYHCPCFTCCRSRRNSLLVWGGRLGWRLSICAGCCGGSARPYPSAAL